VKEVSFIQHLTRSDTMHELNRINKQIFDLQAHKRQIKEAIQVIDTSNMTKQEIIDKAMTLPEIPEHLWEAMQDFGFQTGSSVFGNINTPSDIDWVVNLPAYAFYYSGCALTCGKIQANYIDEGSKDFVPFYANKDGKLYNIICIGSYYKLEAWKETTRIMTDLSNYDALKDIMKTKWKRVRLFRALTDVFEPVKPLYHRLDIAEAHQYDICCSCGREAVNFTCKAAKDHYKATGVCERCA